MVASPIACTKHDSSRREQNSLATYPRTLPPPSTGSTEALRQPAGVATLYSLDGYLDSSAHESPRSNRPTPSPPLNSSSSRLTLFYLPLCKATDSDPCAIRDTLVRLTGLSRHPRRYPRLESDPCQSGPLSRRRPRVSGGFHDTRSTWAIDSKVSSNS